MWLLSGIVLQRGVEVVCEFTAKVRVKVDVNVSREQKKDKILEYELTMPTTCET